MISMNRVITLTVLILCTVLSPGHILADVIEGWPEGFSKPSVNKRDTDSRFEIAFDFEYRNDAQDIIHNYDTGLILTDLSGLQPVKEVRAQSKTVWFNDIFPETQLKLSVYIIVGGQKYISTVLNFSTPRLMRDQMSQWGDYTHTATTITINGLKGDKLLQIWDGSDFVDITDTYTIENLEPRPYFDNVYGEDTSIKKSFRVCIDGLYKDYEETLYTARLPIKLEAEPTPTGLMLDISALTSDAEVETVKLLSPFMDDMEFVPGKKYVQWIGALTPNTSYSFELRAIVKNKTTGTSYEYPFRKWIRGTHYQKIPFTTQQSVSFSDMETRGVSASALIASAKTNIDDNETSVGFQWKKYDAPATLKPSEGFTVISDGMLEGKIKNLQTQSYYDIRPFYKDRWNKYVYGEWITIDPSDFSYLEPVVHTFEATEISATSAVVTGYVLEGSDDIIEQGFEYGPQGGMKIMCRTEFSFANVISTGQKMTVNLEALSPNTAYVYRAYAKTSAGTFYGDDFYFTTEAEAGISEVGGVDEPVVIGYYSSSGIKSSTPQKGFNIIVYSDGSTRKVIIR